MWWTLLDADVFKIRDALGGRSNSEELVAHGVSVLRNELNKWYAKKQAENPTERLAKLMSLDVKTLGTRDGQQIRTKAAETRCA